MSVTHITTKDFKEKVFDYTQEKEWKFKGSKPMIVDFYADWCGPCKMLTPILEELASEYGSDVDIVKVDTEKETELSSVFGIRSIPSILFIPVDGQPMMQAGLLPKAAFEDVITNQLLKAESEVEKE
jgi:thioredoxin